MSAETKEYCKHQGIDSYDKIDSLNRFTDMLEKKNLLLQKEVSLWHNLFWVYFFLSFIIPLFIMGLYK